MIYQSQIPYWNLCQWDIWHHLLHLQVFSKGIDKDMVVLMAARASRLENQDAIDAAIVSMLADPKEVSDHIN